jgi:hypothetical protein
VLRINTIRTHGQHRGEAFFHDFGDHVRLHGVEKGAVLTLADGTQIKLDHRTALLFSADAEPLYG